MKSYKAKARLWIIEWDGHEIRLEFHTKINESYNTYNTRVYLFFDGKPATPAFAVGSTINATIETEDGIRHLFDCGVFHKSENKFRWPPRKSFWGRIEYWVDRLLSFNELHAFVVFDADLIYLSHIGFKDAIEWVEVKEEQRRLEKEERALIEGKILILSSTGFHKREASKEELEQAKIRLAKERKGVESRLKECESKFQ